MSTQPPGVVGQPRPFARCEGRLLLSAVTLCPEVGDGEGGIASVDVSVYEFKVVRVVTTAEDALEGQLNVYGEQGFAVVGVAEYSGQSMIVLQRATTPEPGVERPTHVPRGIL